MRVSTSSTHYLQSFTPSSSLSKTFCSVRLSVCLSVRKKKSSQLAKEKKMEKIKKTLFVQHCRQPLKVGLIQH